MENQPPTTGRPLFRLLSQIRTDSALQPSQPAPSASRPPIQQSPVALTRAAIPQSQTSPQPQPQPPPPQTQTQTQNPPPPLQLPQPPSSAPLSQVPPPQLATVQPQPSPATQGTTTRPSSSVGTINPQLVNSSASPPQRDITAPRFPTPPQSPRVAKPSSPTPLLTPMVKQLQPLPPAQPIVNPEPEPKLLLPSRDQKSTATPAEAIKGLNSHSQADLRALPPTKNQDKNAAALDARGPSKATASKKEDAAMSIITLAGENMGAYMELRPHPYHQYGRKQQGEHYSPGHDDKADTEGKSGDKATKAMATKNKSISTCVNSNVQSVNNSILFNTSCTAHNPGVRIILNSHRAKSCALIPPSKGGNQLHSGTSAENHGH